MKKFNIYFSIIIAAVMSISYISKWNSEKTLSLNTFNFEIPAPPVIKTSLPSEKYLNSYVWNLSILPETEIQVLNRHTPKNLGLKKRFAYLYKKINGIPSILSSYNPSYRWEFYGTVLKNNSFGAIFFNPFLKKALLLKKGDILDKDLIISGIKSCKVEVRYKDMIFNLEIFTIEEKKK